MCGLSRFLLVLAGVFGASGVALAAAAVHVTSDPTLMTAAYFLLFHAAALTGLCAASQRLARGRALVLAGGLIIAAGALLFSGDLASRVLLDMRLPGGPAPYGGMAMIAGWLIAGAAGFVATPAQD